MSLPFWKLNIFVNSEACFHSFVSDAVAPYGGLAGLVHVVLGKPLDKRETMSNWERRPLREDQVIYAGEVQCLTFGNVL